MAVNFKNPLPFTDFTVFGIKHRTIQHCNDKKNVMALTLDGKNFVSRKCGIWEKCIRGQSEVAFKRMSMFLMVRDEKYPRTIILFSRSSF